ncbi:hypothetical protein C0J27_00520 [Candidatus Chromulinivorax destructor]|uniref:Pentapeptide repeat-containing protein n=2 Tax=Candidatus Chromulinivorax destructor TaxID=2066483 RepID=A0A345ZAB8_9BACT|nr:hypothetical protein C0J27_00520 [Candidatus Chromulinivorax destructor]
MLIELIQSFPLIIEIHSEIMVRCFYKKLVHYCHKIWIHMKKILIAFSLFSTTLVYCDINTSVINPTIDSELMQTAKFSKKDNIQNFSTTGICINCDLSNIDFRKIIKKLKEEYISIDLESSDVNGSDFSVIEYENEKVYAHLAGGNFKNGNLSKTNLSYANLTNAILTKADLSNSNLSYANLSGANLAGADLTGVDLSFANLSGANLTGANLTGAKLVGANLNGAILSNSNISKANFTDADLTNTILKNITKFQGVILSDRTIINGTDFTGTKLTQNEVKNADMTYAIGYYPTKQ